MSALKSLFEKRATLVETMKDFQLRADNLTSEDSAKFDASMEDLQNLNNQIDQQQRANQLLSESAAVIEQRAEEAKAKPEDLKVRYEQAFWKEMTRTELTSEERSILNTGREKRAAQQSKTTTAGGFTVPEGFSNMLEIAEKYYLPFTADNGFFIMNTATGNDIPWPGVNDTTRKGRMLNEAANAETSADAVVFAKTLTLKAYKGTSDLIRMSSEIMQDSYFNFQQVIANILAERMGRLKAFNFTMADGSSKPQGLAHKVANTSALRVVAAASTAITRTDIVNLMYGVDKAYRETPNARFMMNDASLKRIVLATVGSADDRPLWVPSMRDGAPSTIEGKPYIVNNDMDTVALNKITVLFGDMSKFVIRYAGDMVMKTSDERFIDTDESAIVLFQRFDSNLLDAGGNPIKGLYHSTT